MDSIIGLLLYVSTTYRDMNPYLKELHLTLDSWRPYSDEEGWRLQGKELKMAKLDGKW